MTPITALAVAGLAVLCAFLAWSVARYGLLFYREARGARKLSTLAGAAAVIAIIVNTLVGTFTQPVSVLAPPPAKSPAAKSPAAKAPAGVPSRDGPREPAAQP